jgi:putative Ca2+/H+ antiporter (TMEM165/GDT1 family)
MKLFATIFGLTFLAELPDKTALATVMLAARRSHVAVFLGAAVAFCVQSAVAVAFGRVFAMLPKDLVHYAAAFMFFALSGKMFFLDEDEEEHPAKAPRDPRGPHHHFWPDARAAFLVIFIAEWGDLTQLSTAAFAAKYKAPLTVFCGATLGLWLVSLLAVLLGNRLKDALNPSSLRRAGAVAFALVGAALLSGVFG